MAYPRHHYMSCEKCGTKETFRKPKINHGFHLFMTVITGGIWLISYAAVLIGHRFQPWECSNCSHQQYPVKKTTPPVLKSFRFRDHVWTCRRLRTYSQIQAPSWH